ANLKSRSWRFLSRSRRNASDRVAHELRKLARKPDLRKRRFASATRHLPRGLRQDIGELRRIVVAMLGDERGEVAFEEHKRDDVLESLRFAVSLECLLPDQRGNARDRRVVIACVEKDRASELGMEITQAIPPLMIARARHRIVGTGDLPALKML